MLYQHKLKTVSILFIFLVELKLSTLYLSLPPMLEYIITGKNLDRVLLNSRCPEHHGFGTIMSVNNNLFSYIWNKCMEMTRASNFDRTSPKGNLKFQKNTWVLFTQKICTMRWYLLTYLNRYDDNEHYSLHTEIF